MAYIETNDRTQLFYTDGGSGQPVIFVASAWLSSRMWEFQTRRLVEEGLQCIAYDRRGHGRSDWPWDGYDYDTLADDLSALLEHLDVQDATLVAHSMGGGEVVRLSHAPRCKTYRPNRADFGDDPVPDDDAR